MNSGTRKPKIDRDYWTLHVVFHKKICENFCKIFAKFEKFRKNFAKNHITDSSRGFLQKFRKKLAKIS